MISSRFATKEDLSQIVSLHLERFNSFFLTSLGKVFLTEFYRGFLKNPGLLIVLEDEAKIVGFAAGSYSNNSFFKKLLKNNLLGFFKAGVILCFRKPKAIFRLGRNAYNSTNEDLIFSELLSICTTSNKKGYGKILLHEFENTIFADEKSKLPISLTTDFKNNDKVVTFYKECGYTVYKVFYSYNSRKMYRFIKYK